MGSFLIVHPFLDAYGGAERVCENIIKALVMHNQDVELATFSFDVDQYEEIMGDKIPTNDIVIHSLEKKHEIKPPFVIYKRYLHIRRMLKGLRHRLKYDFLFFTQASSPFEPIFFDEAKKNLAYVHFPEIHFNYEHSGLRRKLYLWPSKKLVEKGVKKLHIIFCNSDYTREMIKRYWDTSGIRGPLVVYPPVDLSDFWCDKTLEEREKRVVYVGRFVPMKRHEIIKKLAKELPAYEFVSIGRLTKSDLKWFYRFSKNAPGNYTLMPNLPRRNLIKILQNSKVYVHLMDGEHFGIAPIEGLASGCVTLVHDSGGIREFIPDEFRWRSYDELKRKILNVVEASSEKLDWNKKREGLWNKIANLNSKRFQDEIWLHVKMLIE